ncbi:MAG: zinc metalloprotease HtpX [Ignavibacteria bacterium]|nr:zinc metalloprotease HtpX [Ignavibacteria bacterium]
MNTIKTVIFMSVLTVLVVLAGNLIGGQTGMFFAFLFAVVMNFGSYWFSDKIVLKMYGAIEVDRSQSPYLFDMVERLAQKAQIPMPKLYVINDATPNAFATGRNPNHAAVAVTSGITGLLSNSELEGVIAHELAHIKNRDILIGAVASTFAGAITMLANMAQWAMIFGGRDDEDNSLIGSLVLIIVAPIAATMLQLAISRSREYIADASGAKISGNPLGLASALQKLSEYNSQKSVDAAGPATAHMFIVNPLRGGGITKLFSTHPPIEERVKKLQEIAAGRA